MSRAAVQSLDSDLLECLTGVMESEIGLSIVDLGLVVRAVRLCDAIEVDLTLTSRACPLGQVIVGDVRERLAGSFQDALRIDVRIVWEPIWTPELLTDRGRAFLGRPARIAG